MTQQKYDLEKKRLDEIQQNNDEKVNEYAQEIQHNNEIIQTLHAENANLSSHVATHTNEVALQNDTQNKVKKLSKLESQIESNLSKFRKDISFLEHNDNCPTCRQTIATEFKESEVQELQRKSDECEHGLKQLEAKLLSEQAKLNRIAEIQSYIQTLQIKIATNSTTITATETYITKLKKQIDDLKALGKTDNDASELNAIKDALDNLKSNLRVLIDDKNYYEIASNLLKDTGIKTKIIKQYLPIINKLVNKYLSSLDFFVNFTLDESFKETIKSRYRDEFSYANFSEGEKQRIDMALMLTWRAIAKLKNSTNTNLLILDEIFDSSLDASGTEDLMKILHMLEDVSLFVISHKGDVLLDKFANIIRFEKQKNFSRIIK
jgi:DNA repair exonuclease SbcCD ATPase subunit